MSLCEVEVIRSWLIRPKIIDDNIHVHILRGTPHSLTPFPVASKALIGSVRVGSGHEELLHDPNLT